MYSRLLLVVLVVLSATLAVYADTLKLKNGTVLEGTVIPQGANYWIRLVSGESKSVKKSDVVEWVKGGSTAGTSNASAPAGASGASAYAATKSKADRVEAPILAVQIWEQWIESNPKSADLAAAKIELELWQKRHKDQSEKVNGKWMTGEEQKQLMEKVNGLLNEGITMCEGSQYIEGIKKLEEALKLHPQSFEANFWCGYFYLFKGIAGADGRGNVVYLDKAVKSLEAATKARPDIAAAWSNLAFGYNLKKQYVESVRAAYKAAKMDDSKDIVQNLVNSLAFAPGGMQKNNAEVRKVMEDAILLASKHGISFNGGNWKYCKPRETPTTGPKDPSVGRAGPAWSGSGFFITSDGYLLTNHHVATGDPKTPILPNISFRVRMDDGKELNAELIAVSDQADIALMKVKTDVSLPYLKIAQGNPRQGAKALVLGYPFTGVAAKSLEVSEGQVKSIHEGEEHEIWLDLNTTHGNSGGPVVDKNRRVIAILTAGRPVDEGFQIILGVGPNQIQKFLKELGDKAPKPEYVSDADGTFDGEKLTEEARKSTVLIIAVRGGEKSKSSSDGDKKEGEKPVEEPKPAE